MNTSTKSTTVRTIEISGLSSRNRCGEVVVKRVGTFDGVITITPESYHIEVTGIPNRRQVREINELLARELASGPMKFTPKRRARRLQFTPA